MTTLRADRQAMLRQATDSEAVPFAASRAMRSPALLAALGTVLVAIGAIDVSFRAAVTGVALLVATYGVHRKSAIFWWSGCVSLAVWFGDSMLTAIVSRRSAVTLICSVLEMLVVVLIGSWWWRQRPNFSAPRER